MLIARNAKEEISSVTRKEVDLQEYEESHYEWELAKFYLLQDSQSLLKAKKTGYSKDIEYYQNRVRARKEIFAAKSKIIEHYKNINYKKNTSTEVSIKLLEYLPLADMTFLRWYNLEKLFSSEVIYSIVQNIYNIKEIESEPFPLIETHINAERMPSSEDKKEDNIKLLFIGNFFKKSDWTDWSYEEFLPSNFSNLEEKADELNNFLNNRKFDNSQFVIISSYEYSAIVFNLINQNSTFRRSHKIKGWISINGFFYEPKTIKTLKNGPEIKSLPNRSLASSSVSDEYIYTNKNFPEDWKKIYLPLGEGFPVYSLLDPKYHERSFLAGMVILGGNNYYCKDSKIKFWLQKLIKKII